MSDGERVDATAAHEEYMAEARELVDEQVDVLYALVNGAMAGDAVGTPGIAIAGASGGQAQVTRNGHSMTVSRGGRTVTLNVEAITDLPEGADRAHEFVSGQARCTVQGPDGTAAQWVLQRVGAGSAAPPYTWVDAPTSQPLDTAIVAQTLQTMLA